MLRKADFDRPTDNGYPTGDGKPMAETDYHRDLMVELIETLRARYAADPGVYVSGNLLVFYDKGNKRRHLSPDVFVVRGVGNEMRPNYLIWEEGKGPEVVFELTSESTRSEDVTKKFNLYRDRLGVKEYFLFDPLEDYLAPSMQGFRRVRDEFRPIPAVAGRLPSRILGLHLERNGEQMRLWNPAAGAWLPTPGEARAADRQRAEAERERAEAERERAEAERERADAATADADRLRRENEELRRRLGGGA